MLRHRATRRTPVLWAALALLLVHPGASPAAPTAAYVLVEVAPSQGELPLLLRKEAKRARASGRRAFAYVHAAWCGPCHHLEESLRRDARVQRAFEGVHVVRLDNDAWGDALVRAGLTRNSMPKFFELDARGRPTGRTIDGRAWNASAQSIAAALSPFFQGGPRSER